MLKQALQQPVFSAILSRRTETVTLVAVGGLQLGLHLAGLPAWQCPFKQLTGLPCPGCGLTTAAGQLLRGQFLASLHTHPFAGVFLAAFVLMAVRAVLPQGYAQGLVEAVTRLERRTGFTAWVLGFLFLFWFGRLWGGI